MWRIKLIELELKLLKTMFELRPPQLLLDLPPKDRVGCKVWPDLEVQPSFILDPGVSSLKHAVYAVYVYQVQS
jgi:hypothetical protein